MATKGRPLTSTVYLQPTARRRKRKERERVREWNGRERVSPNLNITDLTGCQRTISYGNETHWVSNVTLDNNLHIKQW